jgi:hypothetical protein
MWHLWVCYSFWSYVVVGTEDSSAPQWQGFDHIRTEDVGIMALSDWFTKCRLSSGATDVCTSVWATVDLKSGYV